jgi:ABC-type sulfate transport system substrate-binding protein
VLCVASGATCPHASALHAEVGFFRSRKRGTWGITCWGLALTLLRQAGARREDERGRRPPPKVSLTLVSFSTTRKAYERITARFAREYQAATGQPVRFRLSFGGSGTQARPARTPR